VEDVVFPSCGHTSCNGFVNKGAEPDYCKACTDARAEQAKRDRRAVQEQLEKEDAALLFTLQSQFKSESMKQAMTTWLTECGLEAARATVANSNGAQPASKKLKVEK